MLLNHHERLNSREHNNFNLLRLLAAIGVIITHSYALLGKPEVDFLKQLTHGLISASKLGVYVFFVISGYLVTKSLERSASLGSFFKKRALRIFPALVVVVVLAAGVLGPLFTELSWQNYFTSFATYRYLGGVFLYFITYRLPGVFLHNPYPGAINGSLWTLPYEWTCYVLLVGLAPFIRKNNFKAVGAAALGAMALRTIFGRWQFWLVIPGISVDTRQLLLYLFVFLGGAVLAQAGARVPYRTWIAAVLLFVLLALVFVSKSLADYWLLLVLPYLLIWLAALPLPTKLQQFFVRADFSYGLYIYAFPVAQILIYYFNGFNPHTLAVATTLAALPFAIASWYLVERPALKLK